MKGGDVTGVAVGRDDEALFVTGFYRDSVKASNFREIMMDDTVSLSYIRLGD